MTIQLIIGIIFICIVFIFFIVYQLLFKEYSLVRGTFETLVKVIETRDLILMRLLPEIKNKKIKDDMTALIGERIEAKQLGNDKVLEMDVKINKKLDRIYSELNKSKNPIVIEELKKAVNFEKKLKTIRREYNKAVEIYNNKLIKHPKLMMKYLRMRPLNTYQIKEG